MPERNQCSDRRRGRDTQQRLHLVLGEAEPWRGVEAELFREQQQIPNRDVGLRVPPVYTDFGRHAAKSALQHGHRVRELFGGEGGAHEPWTFQRQTLAALRSHCSLL